MVTLTQTNHAGGAAGLGELERLAGYLREGALAILNDGTSSQIGPSSDDLVYVADVLVQAASRLRAAEGALSRQADNMAFVLNHHPLPDQWYDKFTRELAEDRAALPIVGGSGSLPAQDGPSVPGGDASGTADNRTEGS